MKDKKKPSVEKLLEALEDPKTNRADFDEFVRRLEILRRKTEK